MENAVNARLLVHKMIHVCMRCPKEQHGELVQWCEAHKELVAEPEHPPDFNPSP